MTEKEIEIASEKMLVIPLSAIPAQRFQVVLNTQNCVITIKNRGEYCYFSLTANGTPITQNTICLCGNNLVPYNTQHFVGSIFFIDMAGHDSIPIFEEFNTRYRLVYIPTRFDEVENG